MIFIGMFVVLTFNCFSQTHSQWYSESTLLRNVKVTDRKYKYKGSIVKIFYQGNKYFFIETRKGYWRKTYIK
jgi:hypothetical protein